MRSRAAHLALSAVALAAIVAAAVFIVISERSIAASRTALRAFDAVVRETTASVADFQGDAVARSIGALRSMASTEKARESLDQAVAGSDNFTEIAALLDHVNSARLAEIESADAREAGKRKLQAMALAGAAGVVLAVIAALVVLRPPSAAEPAQLDLPSTEVPSTTDDLVLGSTQPATAGYVTSRPAGPVLRAASQLCTDLGRVSDIEELRQLVGRAADVMDASGLIVWMGTPDGSQLVPALSHGYLPEIVSRFPPLARSAENAAARAYRTSQIQIVLARPGESNGAIVAPVLSSRGCVGVLSAEIRGGGETSESVQALAAIFAAQLAGVIHSTPEAHEERRATGT